MRLREVEERDRELLFEWANEEETRRQAINPGKILWESHVSWFDRKLSSDDIFLILEVNGRPVAQIRFDKLESDEFLLSYSVDLNQRGLGYGTKVIQLGIDYLQAKFLKFAVLAQVKPENLASNKVFKKLNFKAIGKVEQNGQTLNQYQWIG